jgi:hypothetical protein
MRHVKDRCAGMSIMADSGERDTQRAERPWRKA